MPNDRAGVNWSIDCSHFGIAGSSPGFGRPRHWRNAANSSSAPSSSLIMLTVFVGPLPDEKLLPPASATATTQISARPKTKPTANDVPFVFALGVTSIRMIAMIGTTLIAAPAAYGRISPIALPYPPRTLLSCRNAEVAKASTLRSGRRRAFIRTG
jgi:hypothetical protein